ncbi:MAG: hypothetical protein U9R57_10355 [Thermodesulfobacteriota bacterium]|nr:hypothetical protein [Thermodesulfobacteriota bacterium]
MGRMIVFRVINNRMQFKCAACDAKRNFPVQANIRRKNMRCHKCDAITRCMLNRRITPRELHSGKAVMITKAGKEIAVNIHDISISGGIGLEIPIKTARARTITVGEEVHFNCKWNPRLLGSGRFLILNSNGQRIGIKKVL